MTIQEAIKSGKEFKPVNYYSAWLHVGNGDIIEWDNGNAWIPDATVIIGDWEIKP